MKESNLHSHFHFIISYAGSDCLTSVWGAAALRHSEFLHSSTSWGGQEEICTIQSTKHSAYMIKAEFVHGC